jgi:hypothetical protein
MRHLIFFVLCGTFCIDGVKIHAFVSEAKNGYDTSILTHTDEQVRVLLGCVDKIE